MANNDHKDCLFCKIVAGEVPSYKIYETDLIYCFLDIYPIELGHTLIIPKKHADDLLTADTASLEDIGPILQKLSLSYKQSLQANGFNVYSNNGKTANQEVGHLHFHLVPRYTGKPKLITTDGKTIKQDDFEQVQESITSHLNSESV